MVVEQKELLEGGIRLFDSSRVFESDKPIITIITTVLNGAATLNESIESVRNQTYPNIEFIVADGASTDNTIDILKHNSGYIDYWYSCEDDGVYDAMNKAVKYSSGDYILFLGCDDVLYDVLHEVVNYFSDTAKSYYGDVIMTSNKERYDGLFGSEKLVQKNIAHQAIFYSRQVFDKYKFNLKYKALADYDLNIKLYSDRNFGFKYIHKTIALYNDETGFSSTTIDYAFISDKPKIIFKYFSLYHFLIYLYVKLILKKCW